jgi:hypothetical protein
MVLTSWCQNISGQDKTVQPFLALFTISLKRFLLVNQATAINTDFCALLISC